MASNLNPLQPAIFPVIGADGKPTQPFLQYLLSLDASVRGMLAFFLAATFPASPTATPALIAAANDAAAAAAGVAVGQFYRNGSVVQIRVT